MIIDKKPYFPEDSRYPEYEKGLISLVKGIFENIFTNKYSRHATKRSEAKNDSLTSTLNKKLLVIIFISLLFFLWYLEIHLRVSFFRL